MKDNDKKMMDMSSKRSSRHEMTEKEMTSETGHCPNIER